MKIVLIEDRVLAHELRGFHLWRLLLLLGPGATEQHGMKAGQNEVVYEAG